MATKPPVETVGIDPNPQRQLAIPYEETLQKRLDKFLYGGGSPVAQKIRNLLNGTWLGEPLHVILIDIPIGAWTVTLVFDAMELIVGRRKFAIAADTSLAIGFAGPLRKMMPRSNRNPRI